MKIAVGMVTFNNPVQELKRFSMSLRQAAAEVSTKAEISFLTVDNGQPTFMDKLYPGAITLPTRGNTGYTNGINRLMNSAFQDHQVDAFLTANPDGAFHHNALLALYREHQLSPRSLLECMQFPEEHPKAYDPSSLEVQWASGCTLFIPRAVYEKIGIFDENFFMYMEDVDYSWRARLHGFTIKVCDKALFSHSVLNRTVKPEIRRYIFESGRYLAYKWGSRKFQVSCESALLEEKFYPSKSSLPLLPQPPDDLKVEKPGGRKISSVVCFDKLFTFADPRW